MYVRRHLVKNGTCKEHTRTHTSECPFRCNVCGRKFNKASNLKRHAKIHAGEHLFQCDVCERTFTQNGKLTEHKKTHTGERPFQCDVCEKKFIQKVKLTEHKMTHAGERPFQCDECGKTFTQRGNLTEHNRIHSDERPFQCERCKKRFAQRRNLTEHERIHTDKHPFECTECGKCFRRKTHLNNHTCSHSSPPPLRVMRVMPDFTKKAALNAMCILIVKNSHIKANRKFSKISSKRCTTDRNPVRPGPDHNNEKSLESSHCDANLTSTTSNQHIKSKTHTTNSETGLTTPGDVSTITQLPSVSNQPSTSDIHINKSQNQEEYREYTETVALLNEFADTYPITPMDPGSCEHHDHDDLFLDQEMPEATFPDKQNADAGYLITQLHPVAGWPLTSGIHVNKSQPQEKYEEIAEVLDYNYLQTILPPEPSWKSGCPLGNCDGR